MRPALAVLFVVLVAACGEPPTIHPSPPTVSVVAAAPSPTQTTPPGATTDAEGGDLRLSFERRELPEGPYGTPKTAYALVARDAKGRETRVELGTFDGVCSEEPVAAAADATGNLAHLACWWAGAGDEISVVPRGAQIAVVHVGVGEDGPPTTPRDLATLPVPPGARARWSAGAAPSP